MMQLPRILGRILDILFYGLAAIVALGSVVAVVGALSGAEAHLVVPIHFVPAEGSMWLTSEEFGRGVVRSAIGWAEFEGVGGPVRVVSAVAGVAVFVTAMLLVLHLLRRLVGSVAAGSPFTDANVSRIRWIGLIAVGAELAHEAFDFWLQIAIRGATEATGLTVSPSWNLDPAALLLGFVIVALAEAFRHGSRLQLESDLTV